VYRIAGTDRSPATLYRGAVDRDALGAALHRFTVKQLHRMREIGILADVQRHELLDGVVLDLDVDAQARAATVAAYVAVRLPWSCSCP